MNAGLIETANNFQSNVKANETEKEKETQKVRIDEFESELKSINLPLQVLSAEIAQSIECKELKIAILADADGLSGRLFAVEQHSEEKAANISTFQVYSQHSGLFNRMSKVKKFERWERVGFIRHEEAIVSEELKCEHGGFHKLRSASFSHFPRNEKKAMKRTSSVKWGLKH